MPASARNGADAGAHETRADNGEFFDLGRRHVLRTRAPLFSSCIERNRLADHRRGFLGLQDVGEVAGLDPQRRDPSAIAGLHRRLHDRARGGIIVVGLACGRAHSPPGRSSFRLENRRSTGSLKPFTSQGATALPPPLIQSFAVLIRSAAGTIASTSFCAFALVEIELLALQHASAGRPSAVACAPAAACHRRRGTDRPGFRAARGGSVGLSDATR